MTRIAHPLCLGLLLASMATSALAQVTNERLLRAGDEPQNWLTYSGTYLSHRYSQLKQIDPSNAKNLELKWVFQARSLEAFAATPLVVDGVMYVTQAPNDVVALDAKTGIVYWIYQHRLAPEARPCCGAVNRGLAILGHTLFMATIDARLVALDARDGQVLWNHEVAKPGAGYSMTLAPLIVKDKVVVGVSGGEFGIRGFVAAYEPVTGREVWRFTTIPGPGEPGHETWSGDSWKTGGGPVWLTGSYDPTLNLLYWGVGNPGPDFNAAQREGKNLYSDSVVALDADTGKLRWYFQFSPNDPYDFDAVQIPVLVDTNWRGSPRKLLLWANRNGFFYVLDRVTGRFLSGYPFVKVNWASGLTPDGTPIQTKQLPGQPTYPGVQGGTNWYSPSYSPRTGLFYLSVWENYGGIFYAIDSQHQEGRVFVGGRLEAPTGPAAPMVPFSRKTPINNWTSDAGTGAVIALDLHTGERKWTFKMTDVTTSGIVTTASDLLFTGTREGYFHALDARTGDVLWKTMLGGAIIQGPMTYQVDGTQYVAVASGNGLFVFALRD
ncbi:MAG: pyrroloquinoline quinone-dependent dehydrogenase [Vicinamibacterales bacterium]